MLSELFKQEGQSIYSFKKGDIIIRVVPAKRTNTKTNENLGIDVEIVEGIDNSFRTPMEFVGIKNNMIYLKYVTGFLIKGHVASGYLEIYENGWELFELPDGTTLDQIR